MNQPIIITHAGRHEIRVTPGRMLRFADGDYPLFKHPASEAVAAPDDCMAFLRQLHMSLLPVFNIADRRWLEGYFDAVIARADEARAELAVPAGLVETANAHRVWCYAAPRPLIRARLDRDGETLAANTLFWLDDGPLVVTSEAAPDKRLLDYLAGVAAPHHPFVRRPLAGLIG